MVNQLVRSVLMLGLSVTFILVIVAFVAKDADLEDIHLMNTKALKTICKLTEYKEACYEAVAEVAKNTSATRKDYIFATFNSTIYELKKAIGKANTIRQGLHGRTDGYAKHARVGLMNCEKLLGYAREDLEYISKISQNAKTASLLDQIDSLLVRLTAARAYQTTCIDEIRDEKLRKTMKKKLKYATKHTYNAEKIIYNVKKILKVFGLDLSKFKIPTTGHRRLVDEGEVINQEGFPSWVAVDDRRILGGGGGAGVGNDESLDKDSQPKDDADDVADNDDVDDGSKNDKPPKFNPQDFFKTTQPGPVRDSVDPNVVVDQNGNGDFKTIKEAIASYPNNHKGRYIIYIKSGEYDEGQIVVNRTQNNVYMYGDGHDKTIITGNLNHGLAHIPTSNTATFVAEGERFMAKNIGFRNTIGPQGHQAVAFRSQSPQTIMVECSFEGYQDTLYYHTHDQFYKNCIISGTVDFIFGSGRAFFQDCTIYLRKPEKGQSNYMATDGRTKYIEPGGVVFQKCKIMGSKELNTDDKSDVKSYLGRPWTPEARVVVMKSEIGDVIRPEGWAAWDFEDGNDNHESCTFREYDNNGPGSETGDRVEWDGFKVIEEEKKAVKYSAEKFIDAGSWVSKAGIDINLKL